MTHPPTLTPELALRHVQELLQAFPAATGYRSMLRRFAEAMQRIIGVKRIGFARVSGRGTKLTLKKRGVKLAAELTALDADEGLLVALAAAVRSMGEGASAELRDGWTSLSTPVGDFAVALVDDPSFRDGTLTFWESTRVPAEPLARQLLELVVRQLQNEARWYRKLDKTQAMLYRDDLTHLYNTRYFELAVDSELRRAERFATQFCLLFIDLDGFKPINDQHGHMSGSSVLKQVADVLRDAVREVDIPIRYGGDEFVIVLLGATSAKGLLVAERIRRLIEQKEFRLEDGSGTARVTASIGVAAYPEHGRDRATLLRMADETMYNSKRNGKNQVTIVSSPA